MSFEVFKLHPKIQERLTAKGYTVPSQIQSECFFEILAKKDIFACAPTGTGKTAAFSLPLIERIARKNEKWRVPTVLVLSPTRELALQIISNINNYSRQLPIKSAAIHGGVPIKDQLRAISKGVQFIVATPGRLLDLLRHGSLDLRTIETLVFDEADRMLDLGFINDIKKITHHLPYQTRQTLLFSATHSPQIEEMAAYFLKEPKVIQVEKKNSVAKAVNHISYAVDHQRRRRLLTHLVQENNWEQVLVFTKTKHGANKLAEQLCFDGHRAIAIHGNKSQEARFRALKEFTDKEKSILVATDVASRGIDIKGLPIVVNFDIPEVAENYVHRVGRTGRAGEQGRAISFVTVDDGRLIRNIENLIKAKIPRETIKGFEPDEHIKPQKPLFRGKRRK